MSLVDPKETRVNVALKKQWNPTIEEIENFFEEEGMSIIIDELLQDEEVEKYFNYRLVQNFEAYTEPKIKLEEETRKNIEWFFNQKALMRDLKINIKVCILKKMKATSSSSIKDMCQRLTKDEIYDIIYNMEETIDNIFDKEPSSIVCRRIQERRDNNTNEYRESIILLN